MDTLIDRRTLLSLLGTGVVAALAGRALGAASGADGAAGLSALDLGWDEAAGVYVLPPLPYAANALEPLIDAETMRLHHDLHHAGYVRGLNAALDQLRAVRDGSLPASEVQAISRNLAFHGSGHVLHVLFWRSMAPVARVGAAVPSPRMRERLDRDFGSFDAFAAQFAAAAGSIEGSGWAILVHEPIADRLMILGAEKHQDLTVAGVRPILPCDVWEHAYYLRYQNRRSDYVKAFMGLIDWAAVESRLA